MTRELDINGEFIAINDGQFDSRDRFVRAVANSADATMTMVTTVSMAATQKKMPSFSTRLAGWRWQCGSVTFFGTLRNRGTAFYTEPPLTNGPTEIAL